MLETLERIALVATRALSVVGLTALMSLAAMTIADGGQTASVRVKSA